MDIIFREYEINDLMDIHEYATEHLVVKHMLFSPNTLEDTKEFLYNILRTYNMENPKIYNFAVEEKASGKMIGACSIYLNTEYEGDIGWILNSKYWNKGIGSKMCKYLLDYGFNTLDLHRMYATCSSENHGSYKIMEKNKMRREGHFIKKRKFNDFWHDEYLYAILSVEW